MKEIKVITLKNGLKLVLLRNTTMRFYYFDILIKYHKKMDALKHVDFLILLRRLLYSENLNSPSAQTVSLSLYTILAKFRKSAYCLLLNFSLGDCINYLF